MTDLLAPFRETPKSPRLWQEAKALRARLTVDTELALPVLRLREGYVIAGERINDLSPLPPERFLREKLMEGARLFVKRLAATRERYQLKTPEADMRIWGPTQVFEAQTEGAVTFTQDEWLNQEGLNFFIVGDFVAEYGFLVPEITEAETKALRITTVKEWEAAEKAATAALYGRSR